MEQRGHIIFAYPEQPRDKHRRLRLHEIRDGHAHLLLSPLFSDLPCRGIFFNSSYPIATTISEQKRQTRIAFSGTSLLSIATRPPLDDPDHTQEEENSEEAKPMKKTIGRSNNWLERIIFDRLRVVFKHCDRKQVELNLPISVRSADNRSLPRFKFQQTDEALVISKQWTLGFAVYLDKLWNDGPDLFCAFGMSGPMTLLWCYLLANRPECREHLGVDTAGRLLFPAGRSFLFAARIWLGTQKIPVDVQSLAFADRWKVEPLYRMVWCATQHHLKEFE